MVLKALLVKVLFSRLNESDYVEPGDKCGEPVDTPIGKVGLGICYDLR
jgi:predicted amidohydrolase